MKISWWLLSGVSGVALASFGCSGGDHRPRAAESSISGTPTTDGTMVTEDAGAKVLVHGPAEVSASVAGTLVGLAAGASVDLVLVSGSVGGEKTLTANGAFTFEPAVELAANYTVSVRTQPANETCVVTNGTGTTSLTTEVTVTCYPAYSVGGNVTGSTGQLVLSNNGGAPLGVSGNGLFTFQDKVASGSDFAVTIVSPPAGQRCAIMTHGSGTVTTGPVTDIGIQCFTPYASCKAMHAGIPAAPSGVYPIAPSGTAFNAYCDMTRDGGGWTRAVNVRPDTSFQGDLTDALADVSESDAPAKLDDATINALGTVGYFRFDCGALSAFVENDQGLWTSERTNGLTWTLDPTRSGDFMCPASDDGYVFSTATGTDDACGSVGMSYVAENLGLEGAGCYAEGQGWYQAGALWVK